MIASDITNLSLEFNIKKFRRRLLEILPGSLSWTTLIGLAIIAFILPWWVAIFIIAYDVYVLIRAAYMSVHLVYAYDRLRRMRDINWIKRCEKVSEDINDYYQQTILQLKKSSNLSKKHRWQIKQLIQSLAETIKHQQPIMPWHKVHHVIILPTYDESLSVLRTSLMSLVSTDFPKDRMHVVVGFEERIGEKAYARADKIKQEFGKSFATLITTFHPDGLPGEKRVKSANATWAMKAIEKELTAKNIPDDYALVSNFDSDTVVSKEYFSHLTFAFITHPDRYHVSYQPLPMYNNNLWDAPAFSRVVATGSTFWQMIESTRPERLVTFSSHSMTMRALKEVGYWEKDIISEDSRIFWQCLLRYNGHYQTEPLYTSVSMDAALADSWWRTLKNQYKQKRRWGWGIENFPYLVEGFMKNKKIAFRTKFIYIFRTLEGHHSWATTPIIVAGLSWLPIFFGGPEFHTTVLSYSLPYMARTIMSIAMSGLLISAILSLLLLPPKPAKYSRWRYFPITIQWALVPVIATILSSLPALDAETRLMLGRDLEFNVMEKARKE
jgi:cellulose synthase/poly-beta-1,6-N-acetylglucosamine synthase-like glycosyltransferase